MTMVNFESELGVIVSARLDQHRQDAITMLTAQGYKVTKPRAKTQPARPALNAVGKPFSPQYDPKYKMKHKPSTAHLFRPYGSAMQWVKEGKSCS